MGPCASLRKFNFTHSMQDAVVNMYVKINQNLIINSEGISSSMIIYSKVNFQINSEYLMFNMSYLGK